jgi:hypothetical protein
MVKMYIQGGLTSNVSRNVYPGLRLGFNSYGTISNNMISRVHNTKPGCSSCGKVK